ncbi:hypothetical protein DYB30_009318 [Aphanomyces astaci]|uniref:Uncharacterized protein n=1 Tax=Aphanomyces astaci TaxID=112090 RepID=A0A397E9Q7_APHAT|nr:hypothetical protein DYB30_009318 [Aphanomyces astaci]
MKLFPLRDICWDNPTSHWPPLTTSEGVLAALRGSRLATPDVDITGDGYAIVTFDTPAPVAFLWSASGLHGDTRLYIRDIAVHLHILTGSPPPVRGRHDGQGKPCDRFTYIDPRDRARSKSKLKILLAGTHAAPTRTRVVKVDIAAWATPAPPPNPRPQRTTYPGLATPPSAPPGPTTDLNLYLRREFSTYVDQRIVTATAPLQQEVESLRADKEALTALVSASSTAFSTLDVHLLRNDASVKPRNYSKRRTADYEPRPNLPAHRYTTNWLEGAVQDLHDILYTSAKLKWGETSQTRNALNRAVAIQRTNRCTAQLRHLFHLHEAEPPTGEEYRRLAHMVEWPKWIRNPTLLPTTCWHRSGVIAVGDWWTGMPTGHHPRLGPLAKTEHRTLDQCIPQTARLAYHLHPPNPRTTTHCLVSSPQNTEISSIGTRCPHTAYPSRVPSYVQQMAPHGTAPTGKRWQQDADICLTTDFPCRENHSP